MAFNPIPVVEPFPDDITLQLIHGHYASVAYMDTQVGKLLDGLQNGGNASVTMPIIFIPRVVGSDGLSETNVTESSNGRLKGRMLFMSSQI